MNRKPLFVGNLKACFTTRNEADAYFSVFASQYSLQTIDGEVALAVSFPHIRTAREMIKGYARIGVQDISAYLPGAHTGEVPAELVQSEGADFVILGHSERRAQGETDAIIGLKMHRALSVGLGIVLCVGESREDRDLGNASIVVEKQIRSVFATTTIVEEKINSVTIAYEPIWSVGSDEVPSAEEIHEIVFGIREILRQLFGDDSESIRVLYGGSVHSENIHTLTVGTGADGALIGRASLDVEKFFEMIQ